MYIIIGGRHSLHAYDVDGDHGDNLNCRRCNKNITIGVGGVSGMKTHQRSSECRKSEVTLYFVDDKNKEDVLSTRYNLPYSDICNEYCRKHGCGCSFARNAVCHFEFSYDYPKSTRDNKSGMNN